jgi:nucleotide-binding universal stress UspA family protein
MSDKKIEKILVATDFSPTSDRAVEQAMAMARAFGAELTLLNAWFAPMWAMPDGGAIAPEPETIAKLSHWSEEQLEKVRQRCVAAGVRVRARTVEGPPADAIPRVADEEGYDLIVLGTHGRTGVRHLLLGSVAEHVVRVSRTPVMTVHAGPTL